MPKGSKASKESKRRAVVKAAIAGKKQPQIAREVGISQNYVSELLGEPESKRLAERIFAAHERRIQEMGPKTLDAIDRGLTATKETDQDHKSQLAAVDRYARIVELIQGPAKQQQQETPGLFDLTQCMVLLGRGTVNINAGTGGDGEPEQK